MVNKNNKRVAKAKKMHLNEVQWTHAIAHHANEVVCCSVAITQYYQGSFIPKILDDVFIHHIWPHISNLKQDP
jgi:hypothetical protein